MSSGFVASLIFEEGGVCGKEEDGSVEVEGRGEGYDDWLLERKVKVKDGGWDDGEEQGDSFCFGTRTVDMGMDCVWKLHGGV
jgi:hypothetical protein